jgi:hypothetical protein
MPARKAQTKVAPKAAVPATIEAPAGREIANAPQARNGVHAIMPLDMEEAWRYSQFVSLSGLTPGLPGAPGSNTHIAATFAVIQQGATVGLPPMSSLGAFCIVNGRLSMYGDGQLAVVRGSGSLKSFKEEYAGKEPKKHDEDFPDDYTAVCTVERDDGSTVVSEFSVADAKRAGLWGKTGKSGGPTPWVTNPKRMLRYRARAFALRDLFPDLLLGFQHSAEEIVDLDPSEFQVVTEAAPAAPAMPKPEDFTEPSQDDAGPEAVPEAAPQADIPDAEVEDDAATEADAEEQQEAAADAAVEGSAPDTPEAEDTLIYLLDWEGGEHTAADAAEAVEKIILLSTEAPSVAVAEGVMSDNSIREYLADIEDEKLRKELSRQAAQLIKDRKSAEASEQGTTAEASGEGEDGSSGDGPSFPTLPEPKQGGKEANAFYKEYSAILKGIGDLETLNAFTNHHSKIVNALSGAHKAAISRAVNSKLIQLDKKG